MIKRLRAKGDYALWVYSAQTALQAMGYVDIKINEYNDIFAESIGGDRVRMALSEEPNGRVAFMFDADDAEFAQKFKTKGNRSYQENQTKLKKAQDQKTSAPKHERPSHIFERSAENSRRKSVSPASRRSTSPQPSRGLPKRSLARAPEQTDAALFAKADKQPRRPPVRAPERADAALFTKADKQSKRPSARAPEQADAELFTKVDKQPRRPPVRALEQTDADLFAKADKQSRRPPVRAPEQADAALFTKADKQPKRSPARAPEQTDADRFAKADRRSRRASARVAEQPAARADESASAASEPHEAKEHYSDPFGSERLSTLQLDKLNELYEEFEKDEVEDDDKDGMEIFEAFDPFAFVDNPRFYFYVGKMARKIVVGVIIFIFGYFLGNL